MVQTNLRFLGTSTNPINQALSFLSLKNFQAIYHKGTITSKSNAAKVLVCKSVDVLLFKSLHPLLLGGCPLCPNLLWTPSFVHVCYQGNALFVLVRLLGTWKSRIVVEILLYG